MSKYNERVLKKINNLYKYVYDKTLGATELSDSEDEIFAYVELQNDIHLAYRKFKESIKKIKR